MGYEQRVADLEKELDAVRRQLASARAESGGARFFRELVESSSDSIVVIDAHQIVTYASPGYERSTGRAATEYMGNHVLVHTHPEARANAEAWIHDLLHSAPNTVLRLESRHRAKSGEWIHTEVVGRNLLADPFVRGVILVTRDIGNAVRLREDLRSAQARYEDALLASSDALWEHDLATDVMTFSPILAERLGYETAEFPRTMAGVRALYHPDDVALVSSTRERNVARLSTGEVETRIRTKSGDYRWYRIVGKVVHDGGRPVRLVGRASDVHERKLAEIALRDSERMFRALFEDTSVAVTVRDLATQRFLDCNPAALRLYGFESREQLYATTPDQLAPATQPDGRSTVEVLRTYVQQAVADGVARMEWTAKRRDGELFPVDVRTTVITLEDGRRIMQTFIEDVTERTRNVAALERRARRDDLVSRVSRQFVQSGADVALPFVLEALGTFLGADRVRMRRFFDGGATLATVEEWRARGVPAHPHPREDGTTAIFQFVADRLARNGYLGISDIDGLPPEIRALQIAARPSTARSLLVLPVANQGALIGWMVVEHVASTRIWTDDDISTARLVTEIVAMGRARAEAEEKTQRRAAHDELLSEVSRRFLNEDPEAATGATVERVGERLEAESVSLFALDEHASRLQCTHRWGAPGSSAVFESLEDYPVPAGTFVPVESARAGSQPVDAAAQVASWLETLQRDSGKGALYAPVGYGGQIFGLLSVRAREGRAWSEDDGATLRMIGELIAVGRVRRAAEVALAKAKEDAIAASLTKSAFLANMSHELRTPLNGVIGMVDLLATTPLDDRQRRYTEIARTSANLLLSVISDILDFSKIEAGKLELEAVLLSPNDIVEEVASVLALSAEEKGLDLTCQSDLALTAPLVGDPARLRQVLVNLVSNAIKFTRRGEVAVKAFIVSESSSAARVRFEVSDTGVGISVEAQARLFQPFTQVDVSTTREHGGTGLGLAISREIVERMGGVIGLASIPGAGSTFWFEVTFERSRGRSFEVERDPRLAGLRVLAVDDNATNRELLQGQLETAGMTCDTTGEGIVALEMLIDAAPVRPYPLLIVDHHMPGMDGRELALRVKADPRLSVTRVVMLGSVANPLGVADQRAAGIVGYCTKPIWRRQLLHVLRTALDASPQTETHEDRPPTHDAEPPAKVAASGRILLVEDSPINAEVAGEILKAAGYSFDLAVDGALAVELVKGQKYDVVLMDCQLPELDGYEATRRIRALEQEGALEPRAGLLPIIALTASATKEDLDRCLASGMTGHVSKPLDARRLLALIATQLSEGVPPATPSSPPRPAGRAVADIGRALDRLGGDKGLLRRIAALFADGAAATCGKLRAAVDGRVAADVEFATHRLKGQASTFGADALVAAAEGLAEAAKRGNWAAAGAALLGVEKEIDRLLSALAAGVQGKGGGG